VPMSAVQILAQLQAIAAQNELRFEVNRSTALVFQVRWDCMHLHLTLPEGHYHSHATR